MEFKDNKDWERAEPHYLLKDVNIHFRRRDFKIAVVGFGKMGLLHSTILNLLCSRSVRYIVEKSMIIRLGGKLLIKNVRFLGDIESLIGSKEDLDAIYVTTPAQTHFPLAKRFLEAGFKNLFLEKPPTVNAQQFYELLELSKGKNVMVGFQKKFALPFQHARRILARGILGDIKEVRASIKSGDILEHTDRYKYLGRGVLLDLGIHVIDLLCWLFGEELEVVSAKHESIYSGVDDYFNAILTIKGHVRIEFETTWSDPAYRLPETSLTVFGTEGELRASEDYLKVKLYKAGGNAEDYELALFRPHYYRSFPPVLVADHEYTIEDMHFLSTIENKGVSYTNLETCKCTMNALEDLYTRVRHG